MGKNLLKKTNNAIIHALCRHSANNRPFFRNFDQHFFFYFFFQFLGFVDCHVIYWKTNTITLRKVTFRFFNSSHGKIKQRLRWPCQNVEISSSLTPPFEVLPWCIFKKKKVGERFWANKQICNHHYFSSLHEKKWNTVFC